MEAIREMFDTKGEADAAGLLFEFAARRMQAGMSAEDALQDAHRAISEGLKSLVYKAEQATPFLGDAAWSLAHA